MLCLRLQGTELLSFLRPGPWSASWLPWRGPASQMTLVSLRLHWGFTISYLGPRSPTKILLLQINGKLLLMRGYDQRTSHLAILPMHIAFDNPNGDALNWCWQVLIICVLGERESRNRHEIKFLIPHTFFFSLRTSRTRPFLLLSNIPFSELTRAVHTWLTD